MAQLFSLGVSSHATLESHRGSRRQFGHAISRRGGFCLALPLDVASADSVPTVFVLVHLVCHVWRLVDDFAHSFVLGVVRHGIARLFLLGFGCAVRHGSTGLEFASPASVVGISPERICCEHQLQRFSAGDIFGLAWSSIICEIDDMDTPNKSPEPTAVGAVSSAVAVHVASRRWLSFFR